MPIIQPRAESSGYSNVTLHRMGTMPPQKQLRFPAGSRVRVLTSGGWKRSSVGTVMDEPEATETLLGVTFVHWVQFDEPQEDINGPDKYRKAQILGEYLDNSSDSP